ncbi:MAG: cephalosporin hydroxylase family protein [Deltaproteobacteria bacterium]|jgi:cephalosporin hydroxylase|nr:cephalosporin hydroxylase family protein [Deltaproteobacteria bacterium]
MSDALSQFYADKKDRIKALGSNDNLKRQALGFMRESIVSRYLYNFSWLGLPIIQFPQDLVALQEIIWERKPSLIVETGVAYGGSAIFYASLMATLGLGGQVLSIDIAIKDSTRTRVTEHPLANLITLVEGDSSNPAVFAKAQELAAKSGSVMVVLDSLHSHQHVLAELKLYHELVTPNQYLVVFDGFMDHFPELFDGTKPWGPGSNPLTATRAFLAENDDFTIDWDLLNKLAITAAPEGYLIKKG